MLEKQRVALSDFDKSNQHLKTLYTIFCQTLNENLSWREFLAYFFSHNPHFMDITFLKDAGEVVGFICVTFYKHEVDNRSITVCRGATGIKKEYRGGCLPTWHLCKKYISYKMRHPFEEMYVVGFMANPILYSMICKYTHKVYPKTGVTIPKCIYTLQDNLVNIYGLTRKVIAPFVVKIHFQVCLDAQVMERIYSSEDKYVQDYLDRNPDFDKQIGLLTIVPITPYNILVSTLRGLIVKPFTKFFRSARSSVNQPAIPKPQVKLVNRKTDKVNVKIN